MEEEMMFNNGNTTYVQMRFGWVANQNGKPIHHYYSGYGTVLSESENVVDDQNTPL